MESISLYSEHLPGSDLQSVKHTAAVPRFQNQPTELFAQPKMHLSRRSRK